MIFDDKNETDVGVDDRYNEKGVVYEAQKFLGN